MKNAIPTNDYRLEFITVRLFRGRVFTLNQECRKSYKTLRESPQEKDCQRPLRVQERMNPVKNRVRVPSTMARFMWMKDGSGSRVCPKET